jgi:glycosyltransferase involved in cell wall biosynthesis
MDNRSVSIVICSRNSELTIRRCVESVLAQDYPIYEIQVVDGLSKDNTLEILTNYPRIRILTDAGGGLAHARNVGWKVAKGEFVAYIDADSEIPGNWLREILGEIVKDEQLAGVQDSQISVAISDDLTSFLDVCFFTVSAYRAPRGIIAGIEDSIWRRKALEAVSGFNDIYRKYFEDADLIDKVHLKGFKTSRIERIKHKHFVRQTPGASFLQYYWRGYFSRVFDERKGKTMSLLSRVLPSLPSALLHSFLAFRITGRVKSLLVFFIVLQKRLAFLLGYF